MNQKALEKASRFSNIPTMAMSFLLPLYCLDLGFSPIETTGLFAISSLALLISKLLIGNLCDRIGRKKIFCAGLLVKALSYGLLAFSQSAVPLYVAQILNGIAVSLISVSMYAIMSDDRESNFAARQAKLSSSSGKGQLFGVAMSWLLLIVTTFSNGWRYLFLISTAFVLYATMLAKNSLIETNVLSLNNQPQLPKKLLILFSANVLRVIATTMVNVILVLYLSGKFEAKIDFLALILLVPQVIITYVSPALGRLIEKIKEKKAFFFSCILSAFFLVIIPFAQSLAVFAIFWTLYGIFDSVASFAFDSIVSLNAQECQRGKIVGAHLACSNLGSFIGALVAGGAFQAISPESPFLLAGIVFIGCFFAMSATLKGNIFVFD